MTSVPEPELTVEQRLDIAEATAAEANHRSKIAATVAYLAVGALICGGLAFWFFYSGTTARRSYVDHSIKKINDRLTTIVCLLPPLNPLTREIRDLAGCGRYVDPQHTNVPRKHPSRSSSPPSFVPIGAPPSRAPGQNPSAPRTLSVRSTTITRTAPAPRPSTRTVTRPAPHPSTSSRPDPIRSVVCGLGICPKG